MNHASEILTHPSDTALRKAVWSVLSYFEIFKYPLTLQEIYFYQRCAGIALQDVADCLAGMIVEGQAWRYNEFYQSAADHTWVQERIKKNSRADQLLPKAHQMGRFIGQFPFVQAVMVSGSMSKHCISEDSDIDFFLITTPGRLWLARTLLVLYKKIFLFNSHKYFCVNYFIDTDHLEIEEKNLFTATECATLLPVHHGHWYHLFLAANPWVHGEYYPNMPLRDTTEISDTQPCRLKKALEWLLNGHLGSRMDKAAMRLTVWFWHRKFKHFDPQKFDNALKSRRYVSKHHPLWFQQRVLGRHAELMQRTGG